MKYSITVKNGSLGITVGNQVEKYIARLSKKLTHFTEDLPELTMLVKKHDRHHFYSGVFTLRLPHKPLIASVGAHDLEGLLKNGFAKIEHSFETYKGKHFKGSSKFKRI